MTLSIPDISTTRVAVNLAAPGATTHLAGPVDPDTLLALIAASDDRHERVIVRFRDE